MEDLEARILAAEKRLSMVRLNPAPTVPMYDLQGYPPAPPELWRANGSSPLISPILADTTYTFEFHTFLDSMDFETYLNGSLVDSGTSTFLSNGQGFFNRSVGGGGTFTNIVDPNTYFYVWDFRVGTIRAGTNIFSDDLSSMPTSPPWGFVTNETISGLDAIEIVNLSGIGNVAKFNQMGDGVAGIGVGTGALGFTNEEWQYFKLRFPQSFLNNVVSNSWYNLNGIQVNNTGFIEGQFTVYPSA